MKDAIQNTELEPYRDLAKNLIVNAQEIVTEYITLSESGEQFDIPLNPVSEGDFDTIHEMINPRIVDSAQSVDFSGTEIVPPGQKANFSAIEAARKRVLVAVFGKDPVDEINFAELGVEDPENKRHGNRVRASIVDVLASLKTPDVLSEETEVDRYNSRMHYRLYATALRNLKNENPELLENETGKRLSAMYVHQNILTPKELHLALAFRTLGSQVTA